MGTSRLSYAVMFIAQVGKRGQGNSGGAGVEASASKRV